MSFNKTFFRYNITEMTGNGQAHLCTAQLHARQKQKAQALSKKAVAIWPSMPFYCQRLFCHELLVIGQSK